MAVPSFNNIISRGDVAAINNEEVLDELWEPAIQQSAALSLFPTRRLAKDQTRIPVLSTLPVAYWIDGDVATLGTTEMAWRNKFIDVARMGVMVPIPRAVLENTEFDIWAEVRPRIAEAIGLKLDEAVFLGNDKPAILPPSLFGGAQAAGNVVARGGVAEGGLEAGSGGSFVDELNYLYQKVEEGGNEVNVAVFNPTYRGRFRGLLGPDGTYVFSPGDPTNRVNPQVYGVESRLDVMRGKWPTGAEAVEGFAGDRTSVVVGIRKEITMRMLDQAVLQDGSGNIVYNLAQQDMLALRVDFSCGFQVRTLPTPEAPGHDQDADRYPWAVITAPAE